MFGYVLLEFKLCILANATRQFCKESHVSMYICAIFLSLFLKIYITHSIFKGEELQIGKN